MKCRALSYMTMPRSITMCLVLGRKKKDSGILDGWRELKKFCSDGDEERSEIVEKVKSGLDMWTAFFTRN